MRVVCTGPTPVKLKRSIHNVYINLLCRRFPSETMLLSPVDLNACFMPQLHPTVVSLYPSPVDDGETFIPNMEPYTFLLVDDNIVNLRIFSRVLGKLFPKASIRAIQDLALLQLSADALGHYHIIFLDIEMPLVTGTEIAATVRSTLALDHVGLVAVTTRFLMADLELYDRLGFDFTFPKPIDFSYRYMLERIERVLGARTQ